MTTALIIPLGIADTENGRARRAVWDKVRPLWTGTSPVARIHVPHPHVLIVAADPRFPARPFSVARAVNNAVRLAPGEVDRFVTIGADALPDWRVVDWAAGQLEHRPWTLLFGKGGSLTPEQTEEWCAGSDDDSGADGWCDVRPFETPCVGPIAFRRGTFAGVRGYDERFEGWGYEDVDLWLRLRDVWPEYAESPVSPYPLIQFSHPTDHHDLSDSNPNVRLWAEKCRRASQVGGTRHNDHPAPSLFDGAR